METTATAGMVRPMLASAEPSARFMLVCKRLSRAARKAAKPSGSNTSAAIIGTTTVFGAPACATPASTVGVRTLASPTTTTNAAEQQPGARRGRPVRDGGGRCASSLLPSSSRQEVVAVAHGLDEHKCSVEHQGHHPGEHELRGAEHWAGGTRGEVGQDKCEGRQGRQYGQSGICSLRPGSPARGGARRPQEGTARRCRCRRS